MLKYDEFVKEVDVIIGSKISTKKTLNERQEELNLIIHNTARGLIAVNMAINFLSHLADKGINEVLDEYWKDKLNKFKGLLVFAVWRTR